MIAINSEVYKKLENLSNQVEQRLKKDGLAVPVQNDDGSIQVGQYCITKLDGFYKITRRDEIIADKINLPQTAAIIANDLALGKFFDATILNLDRSYGYAEFEERLHRLHAERHIKKNIDHAEILFTKSIIKKQKKEAYKKDILKQFEKLLSSHK